MSMKPLARWSAIVGVVLLVFGVLGSLWGAWTLFDGRNAWAVDVQKTTAQLAVDAQKATQQLASQTNRAILRVKLDVTNLEIKRLLRLEQRRKKDGLDLTLDEKENLELFRVQQGILVKGLASLQKIEVDAN